MTYIKSYGFQIFSHLFPSLDPSTRSGPLHSLSFRKKSEMVLEPHKSTGNLTKISCPQFTDDIKTKVLYDTRLIYFSTVLSCLLITLLVLSSPPRKLISSPSSCLSPLVSNAFVLNTTNQRPVLYLSEPSTN